MLTRGLDQKRRKYLHLQARSDKLDKEIKQGSTKVNSILKLRVLYINYKVNLELQRKFPELPLLSYSFVHNPVRQLHVGSDYLIGPHGGIVAYFKDGKVIRLSRKFRDDIHLCPPEMIDLVDNHDCAAIRAYVEQTEQSLTKRSASYLMQCALGLLLTEQSSRSSIFVRDVMRRVERGKYEEI